jgi:hypothetical protein
MGLKDLEAMEFARDYPTLQEVAVKFFLLRQSAVLHEPLPLGGARLLVC